MNFIDANIFLRAIINDSLIISQNARKLFLAIESGKVTAVTTDLTVAEVVYVLSSFYKYSKEQISQTVKPLIMIENLLSPAKLSWEEVFNLFVTKNIDFIDAYNMVVMKKQGIGTAYSYDRDFDKVGLLKRIEP